MSQLIEALILLSSSMAIAMSLLVVKTRSLVYSATFLAFLGLSNAALFALLGYGFVAIIHVFVYVGAAVMFIIMAVSMMKEPLKAHTNRALGMTATLIFLVTLVGFILSSSGGMVEITPTQIDYAPIVEYFMVNVKTAVMILVLSLAAALIGAIHLARAKERG